jgi:hypothetical protein
MSERREASLQAVQPGKETYDNMTIIQKYRRKQPWNTRNSIHNPR